MYIAFKWLIGLTLAMWLSMCSLDLIIRRNIEVKQDVCHQKTFGLNRNTTVPVKRKTEFQRERFKNPEDKLNSIAFLHCFMFIAGAIVVSLYNRKHEIFVFTKRKFSEINTNAAVELFQEFSKRTAFYLNVVATKYGNLMWVNALKLLVILRDKAGVMFKRKEILKPRINILLLKKLQEIGEERKNLGQLLIAAIHENKNIRMQYQLENMAKNRLVRHIENTQKVIKENTSRYVSFQQLYLVTHQENTFLKSRLKKLAMEKEDAEKNLLELMNEVYKSKNNELKTYCSRFIVRTKENLLNTDVGAEIQKFLDNSQIPKATSSNWQLSDHPDIKLSSTSSWPTCGNTRFAEIVQDDVLVPLVSDAPKLKGLPGEYVWTVKDKDGLIEKLYEYDYESDLDNGDTIRRIREYSVYYDKDCLLDFSSSRTIVKESRKASGLRSHCVTVDYPLTSQRFLTGSEAFQKFMQNNKNVVSIPSRLPRPPLLNS